MGACQSSATAKEAVASPAAVHKDKTNDHRNVGKPESSPASPLSPVDETKSLVEKRKPGYSSGASTESETELLSSSQEAQHKRAESGDTVGLEDIIDNIRAGGDLTQSIVRMETPFGIPIQEVYDGVHDGPVLGSGVSGIVRLVRHKTTGLEYAVKSIDLAQIQHEEALKQLRNEIYIMCQIDHPNIVRLEEVYESNTEIYLVQELCLGGDLFDRLDEQPDYHYTENQCARLVKQMLSAVRYLHSKTIIHRDLKLENFLFDSVSPDSELRMIDFGLSKHYDYGELHHDAVGTPYTVAPEVIKGSYDERSDIWAIGVITYLLLSGETPFGGCDGENLLLVRDRILKGSFRFEPEDIWENVSDLAKDFIKSLLIVDFHKRPTAKDAQRHEWLQRVHKKDSIDESVHGSGLSPNVVSALVSFKEYSDMRKLLCEVISFTLLPQQIENLRSEFAKVDVDSDGELSLEELKRVLLLNAEAGSLGSLTEEEVEDIFNALRVRKTDTTVHWHEFIAAGLSQVEVDERNLQIAFDRLDADRKGYITFDNIVDLVGSSHSKAEMHEAWLTGVSECKSDGERITYEDFVMLMKGQHKDEELNKQASLNRRASLRRGLQMIPEASLSRISPENDDESTVASAASVPAPAIGAPETPVGAKTLYRAKQGSLSEELKRSAPMALDAEELPEPPLFRAQTAYATMLPRDIIRHDTISPLAANKQLYSAHRQMRLAVLEASKRFEDKQASHENRAGLVMRRGSSKEARKKMEQEILVKARKRTGRSKRFRTASDLTGMVK